MSINLSPLVSFASKFIGAIATAASTAPPAAPKLSGGGVTVGNVVAALSALKATDVASIVADIELLLANLGNVSNDLDIAEQLAAIAAKYSLPDAVETEVVLEVVSLVVENMQTPSGDTYNPAVDATQKGYRGR